MNSERRVSDSQSGNHLHKNSNVFWTLCVNTTDSESNVGHLLWQACHLRCSTMHVEDYDNRHGWSMGTKVTRGGRRHEIEARTWPELSQLLERRSILLSCAHRLCLAISVCFASHLLLFRATL